MTKSNTNLKNVVRPEGWKLPEGVDFVFGSDVDGVLADYNFGLAKVVSRETGVPVEEMEAVTDWDFAKLNWGVRDRAHFEELHEMAVRERMFANLPVIDGARDALKAISDAGIHIRIITHRLFIKGLHGISAGDTVEWLDKNDIRYSSLTMVERKADVFADLMTDDAEHNVKAIRSSGRAAAIFTQPHNLNVPGLRFDGWEDAKEKVLNAAYLKSLLHGAE